jgi:hypothetical protein
MATSTDEMYNSNSRYLHKMCRIYFSTEPLEILASNYLISSSILEEPYKVTNSPFGEILSNELELTLYNDNGIFNPKNVDSPYYGRIKRGIKIEVFMRPDEVDEWDPLGVFYVTDWTTSTDGMTAEVVAHDKLYSILNAHIPSLPIVKDVPFASFIKDYFALFNAEVIVDSTIQLILPYGFTTGYADNKSLLADLMMAAIADCYCIHDGTIIIRSKIASRDLRAVLTDDDQIISVSIKQSLSTDYDSVSVTINALQESQEQSVLLIEDFKVQPGTTSTGFVKFSTPGVLGIKSIRAESDYPVKPVNFTATADDIICSIQSSSDTTVNLDFIGTTLETISSIISTEGKAAVELNSKFVQDVDNGKQLLTFVDQYIKESLPVLDLSIRGNPKLQIGDKIQISSSKYKTDYVGILKKVDYQYSGGLHCDISLTADITKEV